MGLIDRTISMTLPVVPKPVVRYFSRPYIAGTTMADALNVVRELGEQGATSTLDVLGEFVSRDEEASANTEAYIKLFKRIESESVREAHASVKLTALGLLIDADRCLENMRQLMHQAEASGNFVRIDMEDSSCTDKTLAIYRRLREEFGHHRVGAVFQSRLHRTLADVDEHAVQGANFRLCKGIYLEPESIAYTDDRRIRKNFVEALDRMFGSGVFVGIATHDDWLVEESIRLIGKHGLMRDRYEFQMLLGVREPLRRQLIADGHRLRVYVPFGANWYAYSVRRLRENPQIAGHVFRALVGRG
ncbi:MAG: proline dehydrogenase [Acidobacteria bacterium]|nr:proline dehydrogenase [Acidobacteriota bacterium]NIM61391.1 proline dehydrogenase [Acidobacteriota bacterium]NIO58075.1 proline dehydrogenase [Acidobacteriota bacterium]NIQ29084.1 proline dehydrogenase [Acidobacteriota bacterium]NIQ83628.1 proline dehydrogenase [Acidobacteriota bacterium]